MGLQKNVASQKWWVFAFDRTDNTPKTGNAAQITAKIAKDDAAAAATNDVHCRPGSTVVLSNFRNPIRAQEGDAVTVRLILLGSP